jgi:hypothetical protein
MKVEELKNPFVKPNESYVRDISPIKHYVDQAASYLSISKGLEYDKARNLVIEKIKNKEFPNIKDPKVTYLYRGENGDRTLEEGRLSTYIADVIKNREILAPTMTTYLPVETKQSLLALDIDNNVKLRNIAKKAMFAAEAAGDKTKQFFENVTQSSTKIQNNSISGAHATPSNPLYNPSSHSTLTSNCRMTSGNGNANNEKLLYGNRHYFSPNIILNNIVSIISNSDYTKIKEVMDKYNLYEPNTEDVMDCIIYSSHLYGIKYGKPIEKIKEFVEKLNGLQKAAFLYTGDLYHVRKHNEDFMRNFIRQLITKVEDVSIEDPLALIKSLNSDHVMVSHQICTKELANKGTNHNTMVGTKELEILAATALNVSKVIDQYSDFIEAFLVTSNKPAAVPYFPDSIRRNALISDTDSTIFTVQDWQIWYHGELGFHPEAVAVAAVMIFLASQSIINILAIMSKNAGIETKRLKQIAMKNEFYYPVIVPTKVAKHYFGVIGCREGNVYSPENFRYDIKGVHLQSSNAPKEINDAAEQMMKDILSDTMSGKGIEIRDYIKRVADIEREIGNGIRKGLRTYFRLGEIKTEESYTRGALESNYVHYLFWKDCFSAKYGDYGAPPYTTLRITTTLDKPKDVKEWLDKMEDKQLANRIATWMTQSNKERLPTLQIPLEAVESNGGIPAEIVDILDVRGMVINISKIFYLILETLGYSPLNEKKTNLISDYY